MLILPLPLLGLGSKSTSLSPGFCVCRPRQYDTICWKLNLISGFFAFLWLIVWADGINKCDWCLAGGRGLFSTRKTLKALPKLSKKCFTELGAKAVFKLVATNRLDNKP